MMMLMPCQHPAAASATAAPSAPAPVPAPAPAPAAFAASAAAAAAAPSAPAAPHPPSDAPPLNLDRLPLHEKERDRSFDSCSCCCRRRRRCCSSCTCSSCLPPSNGSPPVDMSEGRRAEGLRPDCELQPDRRDDGSVPADRMAHPAADRRTTRQPAIPSESCNAVPENY